MTGNEEKKYARVVFEEEISEDATEEEILDRMEDAIHEFIGNHWGINDVEVHKRSYLKDECDKECHKTADEKIKNETEELATLYFATEQTILNKISFLPNNGKECDCDEPSGFCIVEDDNVLKYCLNCGGEMSW